MNSLQAKVSYHRNRKEFETSIKYSNSIMNLFPDLSLGYESQIRDLISAGRIQEA